MTLCKFSAGSSKNLFCEERSNCQGYANFDLTLTKTFLKYQFFLVFRIYEYLQRKGTVLGSMTTKSMDNLHQGENALVVRIFIWHPCGGTRSNLGQLITQSSLDVKESVDRYLVKPGGGVSNPNFMGGYIYCLMILLFQNNLVFQETCIF